MAPQGSPQIFTPLRFVTQQLTFTPTQHVPHVVASLAAALSESQGSFLAAQLDHESHIASEGPVLVHKIKTQISALLLDRNAKARYAAVVLIKAIIEVGGWSVLQGANSWAKDIIGMLGKSNPTITKKLGVLALTRIFILTHEFPSLVRELTTPLLPSFLTTCLTLAKNEPNQNRNDVLAVVLRAFNELVPHHPTSFRPFCAPIRALLVSLMAPTPSDIESPNESPLVPLSLSDSARRLFASLSICAPRNGSSEEWAKHIYKIIECTQRTANLVFRSLIEDSQTSLEYGYLNEPLDLEEVVREVRMREPGFTPWTGISAGLERLEGLLDTLPAFLSTPTSVAIDLPVGELVKLIERLLSMMPSANAKPVRTRPEISRDEREVLFMSLPRIQVSAIDICRLLFLWMGRDAASVSVPLLDQILLFLEHAAPNEGLRRAAYGAISQVLYLFGASLPRSSAVRLALCIKLCCEDLLPIKTSKHPDLGPRRTMKQISHKDPAPKDISIYLGERKPRTGDSHATSITKAAAAALLSSALTNLPKGFISSSQRQQIDRTSILSSNKDIMFASTMNPPTVPTKTTSASSILPFLARAFPSHLEIEALVRPRMPPLQLPNRNLFNPEEDETITPEIYDNDSSITKGPQIMTQHDIEALADPKRSRQIEPPLEPLLNTDVERNLPLSNEILTEPQIDPHGPKRQKITHEDAAATLTPADPSSSAPQAAPKPPRQHRSNDVSVENAFAKAREADQIPVSSNVISPVEEDSLSKPATEGAVSGMAIDPQTGEREEGEGSSDSEIPELEMSSLDGDYDDDEEDGNEDERERKDAVLQL